MGFRFQRRVTLIPGLRVNFSKSGASLSIGHRGFWYTVGPKGRRATVGIPGSGIYYTKTYPAHPHPHPHAGPPKIIPHNGPASPPTRADQAAFLIVIAVMIALAALALVAILAAPATAQESSPSSPSSPPPDARCSLTVDGHVYMNLADCWYDQLPPHPRYGTRMLQWGQAPRNDCHGFVSEESPEVGWTKGVWGFVWNRCDGGDDLAKREVIWNLIDRDDPNGPKECWTNERVRFCMYDVDPS
jgi:hypothetical protein